MIGISTLLFNILYESLFAALLEESPIPLSAWGQAQGPPIVQGLTALHHYEVDQVPWQRMVVGRQQQRVQAEEHTVLHYTFFTIQTGHMHLETVIQSRGEE